MVGDLPEIGRVLQAIAHRNGLHGDGFTIGSVRKASSSSLRGWEGPWPQESDADYSEKANGLSQNRVRPQQWR